MNEFDKDAEQFDEKTPEAEACEGGFGAHGEDLQSAALNAEPSEGHYAPCDSFEDDEAPDGGVIANVVDWICSIVFTSAVIILVNLFLFRAITVSGISMCDTLQDNDLVITTTLNFEPKFGDIVVVQADKLINSGTNLYGEPIIKRVIGTPGDVIRFDLETGGVYRNGELLTEDYIIGPTNQKYSGWVESETDYVVPENCVFVMGDNRKVSHDSRDLQLIGFVDKNYIMGKALFRLYPFDKMKVLW